MVEPDVPTEVVTHEHTHRYVSALPAESVATYVFDTMGTGCRCTKVVFGTQTRWALCSYHDGINDGLASAASNPTLIRHWGLPTGQEPK